MKVIEGYELRPGLYGWWRMGGTQLLRGWNPDHPQGPELQRFESNIRLLAHDIGITIL